jgi:TonB-linked SusC/RagA family outer membrane protein
MNLESLFKKNIKSFFSIMLLFCLTLSIESQAQVGTTITGVVKDDTGFPLPGVNVVEKGTKNFSITDMDGKYKVKLANNNASLVVSYLGFQTQIIAVAGKSIVDVALKANSESLDEVKIVSVGYGTVKRANLTGSIASVSAKELSKVAVTNVAEALAGRLPGVSVQAVDGSPGADIVIRVRGGNSISQSNAPLYVVDGLIVDNLNDIPPSDIESIDVLKDAASTAIYGTRASNGVVLVTTKKAKAGRTSISYNSYFQIKTLPSDRRYHSLSPYEFVLMQYETAALAGNITSFTNNYGDFGDLELYKNATPIDRQDEMFGRQTFSRYNNISVSGGSESTRLSLSYNSNRDPGILQFSGQIRDAYNFKLNHKISNKLTMDAGARLTSNQINGAGVSGTSGLKVSNLVTARPVNGLSDYIIVDPNNADDNDVENFLASSLNPNAYIQQDWRQRKTTSYIFNIGVNWDILDNLKFNSTYNTNKTFGRNLRFYGPLTSTAQINGGLPLGIRQDLETKTYRLANTLNYTFKNLGKHELNILLGQEAYSYGGEVQTVQAGGFKMSIAPEELFKNMGNGDRSLAVQNTAEFTDQNIFSLFSRASYAYNNKYLFSASIRRDQSSKFIKSNNTGYFPAFSAGWKITEESFLKNSKSINELKLRVSYGQTGNDNVPEGASTLTFSADTNKGPGFDNGQSAGYFQLTGSVRANPALTWETTIGRNIGLDFALFGSKLKGSLDVYKNDTKDLLLTSPIPSTSGYNTEYQNIGTTSGQGVELGLTGLIVNKKDFSLSVNANFGTNKFTIVKLNGINDFIYRESRWGASDVFDGRDYYAYVGQSIGLVYGFKTDGFYKVDDFLPTTTGVWTLKTQDANGNPILQANSQPITGSNTYLRPGQIKFKDISGPDGVPDGKIDEIYDRVKIGNTLPKSQGGFGLNANIKGFDITAFFNWQYGNDVYNASKIAYSMLYDRNGSGSSNQNMLSIMNSDNRFTYIDVKGEYINPVTGIQNTPGTVLKDSESLASLNANKTIWSGNASFGTRRAIVSDYGIEDGSFLRLSNVTIGYTIPMENMKKTIIRSVRLYVTGTNLHLWTKYSGYDPDVNTSASGDSYPGLTPGLDYSSFPKNRSFTFGLNAGF